jgi:tape measure domain-containing protein
MSLFLGSIYAEMELDTGKLTLQVRDAKKSLTGLGDESERASQRGVSGFGEMVKASAIGNIAAIGFTKGIETITGAAGEAFGALTSLQNTRASFESLAGGAENASKVMKELATYANSTPFEFGTIASAGKTLLGFGSSVDAVGGQMRMLGDVAGATGGDLGQIARVFGQVQAAGKLTAEDFNQLIDNGVAVGDIVSKQMGIPMSQLRGEMEKGNITFDVFNKAMQASTAEGGKFFGGADKLSQTLTGRISTLKDTFTGLIGTFVGVDFTTGVVKGGGAFDTFSNAIKGATDWLNANKGTITAVAQTIGTGLLNGITLVAKALGGAIGFLSDWVGAFRSGNPLIQGATIFVGALAAGIGIYVGVVKTITAVTKAWTAVTAAWGVVSKTALIGPVGIVIGVVAALIAIGFLVVKNWDTIKSAATTVLGGAWKAITDGLTTVGNFFRSVWEGITGFFQKYGLVILAVVAPIIGIPLLIIKNWGTIVAFMGTLWTGITTTIGNAVTGIINWFTQLPYNLGLAVGTMVRWLIQLATVDIPNFVTGIVSWISQLPGKILGFFTQMWTNAVTTVGNMITGVLGFFAALPGQIWGFLTAVFNFYVSVWTNVFNFAINIASNIISGVIGFFTQLPGRILGAITGAVNFVRDVFNNIKTFMVNGARDAIDNTINFFRELPGKIMGAISGLAGSIGDKFKSIASSAWDGFKKGLGIHSPSYIENAFTDIQNKGASTVGDMRSNMSRLNSIANSARRFDPGSGTNWNDFNGTGTAQPAGQNIYNIELPNVQNAEDFAREFKLAKVGV